MQSLESEIFIDGIARSMVEVGINPLTVHDSVIIKKEHLDETQAIINKVFLEYFPDLPTFDTKELSPDSKEIKKALTEKPIEIIKKKKPTFKYSNLLDYPGRVNRSYFTYIDKLSLEEMELYQEWLIQTNGEQHPLEKVA